MQLPVIVDTDVGGDDVMAIAFLLARPDVRIEAITICNGLAHVEHGARNVLRILEIAGRTDIPVYPGRPSPLRGAREFPERWRSTSDSLLGSGGPEPGLRPQPVSASEYLSHRLSGDGPKVRLLALGPLTNIGEAIQVAPRPLRSVEEIVISGGAIAVPGNLGDGGYYATDNTTAEWNIYLDAFAARIAFESGMKITLVPLDATNSVRIDHPFLQTFRDAARSPLACVVRDVLEANREYIDRGLYYAWDPFVAAVLTTPGVAGMMPMAIEVQQLPPEEGRTVAIANRRQNASVALVPDHHIFRSTFFGAFGMQ